MTLLPPLGVAAGEEAKRAFLVMEKEAVEVGEPRGEVRLCWLWWLWPSSSVETMQTALRLRLRREVSSGLDQKDLKLRHFGSHTFVLIHCEQTNLLWCPLLLPLSRLPADDGVLGMVSSGVKEPKLPRFSSSRVRLSRGKMESITSNTYEKIHIDMAKKVKKAFFLTSCSDAAGGTTHGTSFLGLKYDTNSISSSLLEWQE